MYEYFPRNRKCNITSSIINYLFSSHFKSYISHFRQRFRVDWVAGQWVTRSKVARQHRPWRSPSRQWPPDTDPGWREHPGRSRSSRSSSGRSGDRRSPPLPPPSGSQVDRGLGHSGSLGEGWAAKDQENSEQGKELHLEQVDAFVGLTYANPGSAFYTPNLIERNWAAMLWSR